MSSNQTYIYLPSLWRRFAATLLDLGIGACIAIQLAVRAFVSTDQLPSTYAPDSWLLALTEPNFALSLGIGVLFAVVLTTAVEVFVGRTLGKLVFGLKIVGTVPGVSVSQQRLLARSLLSIGGFLLFGAGHAWMLVDRRHRGWHDLLTSTIVAQTIKG